MDAEDGGEQSASKGPTVSGRQLCAHADLDGDGAHWLEPGEECYLTTVERIAAEAAAELDNEDGCE